MTRALTAAERGLEPYRKVRIVIAGAILHLASATEPTPLFEIENENGSVRMSSDHILGLERIG